MGLLRVAILAWAGVSSAGCNPIGASCISQQETGSVASLRGTIGAGQMLVHRVPYGTDGSQNDINVSWTNQGQPDAPQLQFYATRTVCENFAPANATGPCAILGMAGAFEGHIASSMIIANGRGNPDVLGTPAEYKVWIVGDRHQGAAYSVMTTWFYGPDC